MLSEAFFSYNFVFPLSPLIPRLHSAPCVLWKHDTAGRAWTCTLSRTCCKSSSTGNSASPQCEFSGSAWSCSWCRILGKSIFHQGGSEGDSCQLLGTSHHQNHLRYEIIGRQIGRCLFYLLGCVLSKNYYETPTCFPEI